MKIDKSTLLIACLIIIAFLLGLNLQNKQSEVKPVPEPIPVEQENEELGLLKYEQSEVKPVPEPIPVEQESEELDQYQIDPVQENFERPAEKPKRMVQCPICEGDGFDPRDLKKPCFGCHRLTKVDEETAKELKRMKVSDWPYVEKKYYGCPMCFGSGVVGGRNVIDADILTDRSCTYCHNGKVDAKEYIRLFNLKKGAEEMGLPVPWMPPL